jgi:nickel/cobalt transporter (NicO) family protein
MPSPEAVRDNWSLKRALALSFAVGIRPCTGAILVLIFAIGQGLLWAGVVATFAMAIGTAITVSILAALAVTSRDTAEKLAGGSGSAWGTRLSTAAGFIGALLVTGMGALFFTYSLGPAQPF